MKITITKSDIAKARKLIKANNSRTQSCPVTLAAKRALKLKAGVTSTHGFLTVYKGPRKGLYLMPEPGAAFIKAFDNDENPKPTSFVMYWEKAHGS